MTVSLPPETDSPPKTPSNGAVFVEDSSSAGSGVKAGLDRTDSAQSAKDQWEALDFDFPVSDSDKLCIFSA